MAINLTVEYDAEAVLDPDEQKIVESWRRGTVLETGVLAFVDIARRALGAYGPDATLAAKPSMFMAHQLGSVLPAVTATRALFQRVEYRATARRDHETIPRGVEITAVLFATLDGEEHVVQFELKSLGDGGERRLELTARASSRARVAARHVIGFRKAGRGGMRMAEASGDNDVFRSRVSAEFTTLSEL